MSKEFREYTEQRISDFEKLSSFFPENYFGVDFNSFRVAYHYENYLDKVKESLEKLFERKISWHETDMFQTMIKNNIASKFNPTKLFGEPSIENRIKYSMFIIQEFNKQFGINMTDEEYKSLYDANIKSLYNLTKKEINDKENTNEIS